MTIKTLEYIHNVLKEEERKSWQAYKDARQLQYDYEDSDTPDQELIDRQCEAANNFYEMHSAARDALTDFEDQEW